MAGMTRRSDRKVILARLARPARPARPARLARLGVEVPLAHNFQEWARACAGPVEKEKDSSRRA